MSRFKTLRRISVLVVVMLLLVSLSGALTAQAATIYSGVTLSRSDYDYAPSVMYGDGSQIKMWWGGGTGSGDGIYYSTRSSSWTTPSLVMQKSSSGWDRKHVCDPSVIKGSFSYNGSTYAYAMYYTGTYDNIGYDSHVGVAFSNNGTSWTKYASNPIISPTYSATTQYGAGMPTAYISSTGTITMAYFDSTTGCNYMVTSTDGINFTGKTALPTPNVNEHIGDIAYSPTESKWYISTKNGTDTTVYIYEASTLTSTWSYKSCITSATTGKSRNHNPGWMRDISGNIYIESGTGYKYIYYGTGSSSPYTWNIGLSIYTTGWEFNVNGNRQGWTTTNILNDVGPSSGLWTFVTSSIDPYLTSPNLEFPAASYSIVSVRIANQNTYTDGRIYFKTAAENYYSEDKSVAFTCTNGGGWYTHNVIMTSNAKWTGTITGIRVDPVSIGTTAACGIDFVRITN